MTKPVTKSGTRSDTPFVIAKTRDMWAPMASPWRWRATVLLNWKSITVETIS